MRSSVFSFFLFFALFITLSLFTFTKAIDEFQEDAQDAYYTWFGMTRANFDKERLASAYKSKARQYHPDKNKSEDAQEKFYKIARAFDVLNDDQKRARYNRFGIAGVDESSGGGASSFSHHDFAQDIFERMFNGGFGGGFRAENQKKRGPDMRVAMEVELKDIYTGTTLKMDYKRNVICKHCSGSGAEDGPKSVKKCNTCNGSGIETIIQQVAPGFIQSMQTTCRACSGVGQKIAKACKKCSGTRTSPSNESIKVEVPAGCPDGHMLVFPGMSEERPGAETGSLGVQIISKPDSVYRRDGSNLYTRVELTLSQALLGFSFPIKELDGKNLVLDRRESVTQSGFVQTLTNKGLPIYEQNSKKSSSKEIRRGNLYIEYHVIMPPTISPGLRECISKLDRSGTAKIGHEDEL